MDLKELLRKKLKADASFVYKLDKRTGNFYIPDQVILQFPAGTSLEHMRDFLDYSLKVAATEKNIVIDISTIEGYTNGVCVVTGKNVDRVSLGISPGHNPPPPVPVIHPTDFLRPAVIAINFELQVIGISDSQRLTNLAKLLPMER